MVSVVCVVGIAPIVPIGLTGYWLVRIALLWWLCWAALDRFHRVHCSQSWPKTPIDNTRKLRYQQQRQQASKQVGAKTATVGNAGAGFLPEHCAFLACELLMTALSLTQDMQTKGTVRDERTGKAPSAEWLKNSVKHQRLLLGLFLETHDAEFREQEVTLDDLGKGSPSKS